ncbi:hypothetical protein AGR2A_Lc70169 [Agrobacterium genomosp. 2 str. CFBP 5494]|uniref:Uncharacterized protein n=1 Tax=Agrobacterium genomosp. 2 str. CFBP 5494 TaxID=1183436 RepID=A0A9W5F220_9HYPH|nr:hypothetical protein AGR2A_Lc70169 [Agrobacterium genomosp. 2 str. CFBP 5494]
MRIRNLLLENRPEAWNIAPARIIHMANRDGRQYPFCDAAMVLFRHDRKIAGRRAFCG